MRDIQAFNTTLLAKQAWRVVTKPDCLLSRVLRGQYCIKSSFLRTTPTASSSHGWKGVLLGRDLFLKGLGKAIGNGETTSVWRDPWLTALKHLISIILFEKSVFYVSRSHQLLQ